jgi:hypothetical protein
MAPQAYGEHVRRRYRLRQDCVNREMSRYACSIRLLHSCLTPGLQRKASLAGGGLSYRSLHCHRQATKQHLLRRETMRRERRDHVKRAETLRRVTMWILGNTAPTQEVPGDVASHDVGQRILKRLALRGLVRRVGNGWIAEAVLAKPSRIEGVDPSTGALRSTRDDAPRVDRRDLPSLSCPECHKAGFVRHENVVQGADAARHFYCGMCGHSWKIRDRRTRSFPLSPSKSDERRGSEFRAG